MNTMRTATYFMIVCFFGAFVAGFHVREIELDFDSEVLDKKSFLDLGDGVECTASTHDVVCHYEQLYVTMSYDETSSEPDDYSITVTVGNSKEAEVKKREGETYHFHKTVNGADYCFFIKVGANGHGEIDMKHPVESKAKFDLPEFTEYDLPELIDF